MGNRRCCLFKKEHIESNGPVGLTWLVTALLSIWKFVHDSELARGAFSRNALGD
jgi:hypothetical protein